jgi:uncharacterized protein involved in exopolysaccharide biosynthesis
MERRLVIARVGSSVTLVLFIALAILSTTAGWVKVVMVVGGLVSVGCALAAKPTPTSNA